MQEDIQQLRELAQDLKSRFGRDEAGAGGPAAAARSIALAAIAVSDSVDVFANRAEQSAKSADRQTRLLGRWTAILAVATILLFVATMALATPSVAAWWSSHKGAQQTSLILECTRKRTNVLDSTKVIVLDMSTHTAEIHSTTPFLPFVMKGRYDQTDDFLSITTQRPGDPGVVHKWSISRFSGIARLVEQVSDGRGSGWSYVCRRIESGRF